MSPENQMGSIKGLEEKVPSSYLELEVVRRVDQFSGSSLVCYQEKWGYYYEDSLPAVKRWAKTVQK